MPPKNWTASFLVMDRMFTPVTTSVSTTVNVKVLTLLNMSTFRERITEAAREKGVSQSALAKHLGMSRGNMSHWFGGRAIDPGAAAVSAAADFLGVSALWLSDEKGPKRPGQTGAKKVDKLTAEETDLEGLAAIYKAMPPEVQKLWRRQGRDLLEALGSPSKENPYGKSLGQKRPKKKGK